MYWPKVQTPDGKRESKTEVKQPQTVTVNTSGREYSPSLFSVLLNHWGCAYKYMNTYLLAIYD